MRPSRILIALGLCALLGAGALWAKERASEPLKRLDETRAEGAKLQESSSKLRKQIEDIARNLRGGRGLADKSARIHTLTLAQLRSLRRVEDLLGKQVTDVTRTGEIVVDIRSLSEALVEASGRQSDLLARALRSLRRVREVASSARSLSVYFARRAAYGARLAEDSASAFSDSP